MRAMRLAAAAALVALSCGTASAQSALRIGLAEDPDVLDPSLARTYVGRIVFASICDKLFDVNAKLEVIPQLALSTVREDIAIRSLYPGSPVRSVLAATPRGTPVMPAVSTMLEVLQSAARSFQQGDG